MHAAWSCRALHPYSHHRHYLLRCRAMRSLDAAGDRDRLPPWFLRTLTPPVQARLRLYLENHAGPEARLEWMTFADAVAILRAAARPPITETDPQEWQVEVLHQLKRLIS